MEVGREQGAAAVLLVQMLDRRPGDRQAVEGRGAAADLVENDEGARGRLIEDRGGLDHLHHEGGAAAREIVGRADPREQAVDDADPRRFRRHEAPRLGEHRDQRILAQIGRLARHVRPGDERDAPGRTALRRRKIAVIGDERRSVLGQRLLDHGMAPAGDDEIAARIDLRPHIAALDRERREACGDVQWSRAPVPRP